ncbi:MAG: LrgB family protein [Betaproteobacteria bacterium]
MSETLPIAEIWVYLAGSPLFALLLTLAAYEAGVTIYEKANRNPFANPVAIAVSIVAIVISLIDMPYTKYFEGAQFIHFLLGTATVALAVPIYQCWDSLRGKVLPLLTSLLCGGAVSILTAVGIARLLGADLTIQKAMMAKSVTAPIAMGVAERISASPTLTAVFAVCTGVIGAIVARYVMDALRMQAWWQRGFAIGVAAHGIGTSRAMSINTEAGAFAGLAMGMHGVAGAILIPLIAGWIA